jgi:hypothetical protein
MTICPFLIKEDWCMRTGTEKNGEFIITAKCGFVLYGFGKMEECSGYNGIERPTRYISRSTRYIVLKRQRWSCNICGRKLDYGKDHNYNGCVAHIDHIHPFSKWMTYDGDINEPANLEALCPDCNMKKHSKDGF